MCMWHIRVLNTHVSHKSTKTAIFLSKKIGNFFSYGKPGIVRGFDLPEVLTTLTWKMGSLKTFSVKDP